MEPFLQFDDVTRTFGDVHAVDHVTLAVRQGEVFGLLGPSGCGKTTLLRLAAGFDQPTSGRILLNGRDITALPPNKRPVNTVFQNYALFPHLSVSENIAFGLRVAGRPRAEIKTEVSRMLELVQLEAHADKKPSQISGGQKQRVAIARALINKPAVLLLDEPLAALDLKLRQRMLIELNKIHDEVGTTFVFVTHDQGEAMSLSNRIAVMNHGRVEQLGTPHEIYSAPRTSFVASFIGDTNFIPGKIADAKSGGLVGIVAAGFPAFDALPQKLFPAGSNVLISLRPEKISLSVGRPAETEGIVLAQCTVEEVIYLGSESRYALRAGNERIWAARLHDRNHDSDGIKKGQGVWIQFSPDDALVLERCTGVST